MFWKRDDRRVRNNNRSGEVHLKNYPVQMPLIHFHERLTKIPDRKSQNLDWGRENRLPPQYSNKSKLK